MIILGIETSCDETAASIVKRHSDGKGEILSNIVLSQHKEHAAFGGVVPEIAARAHIEHLDQLIKAAMEKADKNFSDLDAVAGTAGPGLIGGVIVGMTSAKAIALAADCPFIAINHLEGHALTPRLTHNLSFPYLLLLVSGGHTQILLVRGLSNYHRLGTTIDDAVGEAFDKTAKLLSLGHPGGPAVEKAAQNGCKERFDFPRPLLDRPGLNMSFAGLKTAVRQCAEKLAPLDDKAVNDICASFQLAVADILANRVKRAFQHLETDNFLIGPTKPHLVIAGGVAANSTLRQRLDQVCMSVGASLIAPPINLCTDNAAMIAWAGAERLSNGLTDDLGTPPRARWPLDESAVPLTGRGKNGVKV